MLTDEKSLDLDQCLKVHNTGPTDGYLFDKGKKCIRAASQ